MGKSLRLSKVIPSFGAEIIITAPASQNCCREEPGWVPGPPRGVCPRGSPPASASLASAACPRIYGEAGGGDGVIAAGPGGSLSSSPLKGFKSCGVSAGVPCCDHRRAVTAGVPAFSPPPSRAAPTSHHHKGCQAGGGAEDLSLPSTPTPSRAQPQLVSRLQPCTPEGLRGPRLLPPRATSGAKGAPSGTRVRRRRKDKTPG